MEKILIISTHAEDNPEKATLPFVVAVTALASNMQPIVALQSMGVYLATKGYAKIVHEASFPPVEELIETFIDGGGKLLVCSPCIKKRGIEQDDLIEGAVIVNAPTLIKEIGEAKAVLTY
ncbi:MAG: sulfur reduction protein DsrE [Euryarchaeota archaeon]|nr:sulfur reduction protein DsrE [Euryarchaeota archaeon]